MPNYLSHAIERLKTTNWLIHNFEITNNDELFNIHSYNSETQYSVILDSNVYQYILNSYKKDCSNENFKNAIALVIFCQFSNIRLDPTYAVYERIKYSKDDQLLEAALDDLQLFRQIDNTDSGELARYMLDEKTSYILLEHTSDQNRSYLKQKLTRHDRLRNWDSMYVIILMLTHAHVEEKNSADRLKKFLTILVKEFRLSSAAIVFAIIFFGKKPLKKMMKYKPNSEYEENNKYIQNMTWDLYIMDVYLQNWTTKDFSQEFLLASADKALNEILKTVIQYQKTANFNIFQEYLSPEQLKDCEYLTSPKYLASTPRRYSNINCSAEYRQNLILHYEELLGLK